MRIYLCRLILHENLYYATREVGRLYETGRCLHNYALTYALGFAAAPYFQAQQVPRYVEELTPLNERGIYVTPARDVDIHYSLSTFKYASNLYHVEMEKGSRNTPSFGRAKEIAVGSIFEFAILSASEPLRFPRWIRLGLWRSKAEVSWQEFTDLPQRHGAYTSGVPLNPLDVPGQLQVFDLVSMPPVSLVLNARIEGSYHALPNGIQIPAGMQYFLEKSKD
ncbi:MAG: type I-D CRISPR-associated protein Cas5/Csc1 [Candidatus Binatia bacterium]